MYMKDEEKSGCARSRGISDECPEQIGERIKIKGKRRMVSPSFIDLLMSDILPRVNWSKQSRYEI